MTLRCPWKYGRPKGNFSVVSIFCYNICKVAQNPDKEYKSVPVKWYIENKFCQKLFTLKILDQ